MNPLEITLVTNASPTSGVGKPAFGLSAVLQHRGHRVQHALLDARTSAITVIRRVHKNRGLTSVLYDDTIVQTLSRFPLGGKPLFWLRAGHALRLPQTGVIHLTNQTLAFLAARAPARTVVTVWDLIERRTLQTWGSRAVSMVLLRHLEDAARVIVPSQETARDVRRMTRVSPDRIRVISPALAPRFSQEAIRDSAPVSIPAPYNIPAGRPIVLYVGSEHPRKNLPRLLAAVAKVRSEGIPLHMVKVGSAGTSAGRAALLRAIQTHTLSDAVTIVPDALDDELVQWYRAASVFAFPSLDEGFGFPPLEALACGTPVVTSNVSSLPEVVGDAALLIDPTDVSGIADALHRAITDTALRTQLQIHGRQRAAQFTWERTVVETEKVYREIL